MVEEEGVLESVPLGLKDVGVHLTTLALAPAAIEIVIKQIVLPYSYIYDYWRWRRAGCGTHRPLTDSRT